MMKLRRTAKFDRQLNKLVKKGYPVGYLTPCIHAIIENNTEVLKQIKDHQLHGGDWQKYRVHEFHPARISKDAGAYDGWIVAYRIVKKELQLILIATGGHEILKEKMPKTLKDD